MRLLGVYSLLFVLAADAAFAAQPTLTRLFPAGGQRGTTVEVNCTGEFEPWPVSVWSPGVTAEPLAEKGKLKLTIPADLAADRVWLRLYNNDGASPPLPFLIGALAEMSESEPNNALAAAGGVELQRVGRALQIVRLAATRSLRSGARRTRSAPRTPRRG